MRMKLNDPRNFSKQALESASNGGSAGAPQLPQHPQLSHPPHLQQTSTATGTLPQPAVAGAELESLGTKNPNKLFGVSPSDIDKYSRVVFPVCFVCFNLMYWVIYLHISDVLADDLVPLGH